MSPRQPIIAGKTVIVIEAVDKVDRILGSVESKFKKFSTKIGNLSLDLFRGGFVGTIPTGLMLREFQKFEDKILFLSTKLTATEDEFKALEKTIRNLGKTTSFTAAEVADGATVLAQAGFSAKEVTSALQATLDLARGAQITLEQSGAVLANTMRSFGMETSKANIVASQFIAAARLGTLDVLDLKESIKEVLGTVRNLNIDLPTTLALLTQMAERSLKGTKAGTSLNTALLQMASKTTQLQKMFGITLPENIDGKGFINFLEQLYEKLRKLGNLKRTAVLQSIFNIRGGRAITALDDLKKIIDLQKQIANAGDEARKAAVKMDSKFGGAVRRATSAINDLSIALGGLLAGPVTILLDKIPALTAGIEHLAIANPKLAITLMLIPPAMLAIGAAGLTLSFTLARLAGFLSPVRAGFVSLGSVLNKVVTGNFIAATRAVRGLKSSARGIDTGLSALLLTPELRGGRGRNARKTVPSSFIKRALLPALTGSAKGLGQGALGLGKFALMSMMQNVDSNGKRIPTGLERGIGKIYGFGANSLTAMRRNARMAAREAARRAKYAGTEDAKYNAFLSMKNAETKLRLFDKSNQGGLGTLFSPKKADTRSIDDRLAKSSRRLAKINSEIAKIGKVDIADTMFDSKELAKADDYLKEVSQQLGRVNAQVRIQEQAYDRLYSVRQQIKALEAQGKLSSGGVRFMAELKTREATLANIVNQDLSGQQAFFEKEYAKAFATRDSLLAQRGKAVAARASIQKLDSLSAARAAEMSVQRDLQNQRAGLVGSVENQNLSDLQAKQNSQIEFEKKRGVLVGRTERARAKYVKAVANDEKALLKLGKAASLRTRAPGTIGRTIAPISNMAKNAAGGLGKLFTAGGKGFVTVLRSLGRIDWLKNLNIAWSSIKLVTLGFFRAAMAVRRFVFSFSGFLTIVELLLLFGNKIEFIRKSFERLANGFKNAFASIGRIFSLFSSGPTGLLSAGFGQIFAGNMDEGIKSITSALGAMVDIVGNQLVAAWQSLMISIAPVYDYMKKVVLSTFELGSLLMNTFGEAGAQLGNIFKLMGTNSDQAGAGVGGFFSSLFSTDTLKQGILALGTVITGIAQGIAVAINKMVNIVVDTMILIQEAILAFSESTLGQRIGFSPTFGLNTTASVLKNRRLSEELKGDLSNSINNISKVFETFSTEIDKIFSKNTEETSKAAKIEAERKAIEAAQAARRKLDGADIIDVFKQIEHARLFPQTSVWAPKGRMDLSAFGNNPIPPGAIPILPNTQRQMEIRVKDLMSEIFTSQMEINAIKDGPQANTPAGRAEIRNQRKMIVANRAEAKLIEKRLAFMAKFGAAVPNVLQQGSIRDVVAATVGDFTSTRNNLLKVAGKSTGEQTNELLGDINSALGGGVGTPYLKQMLDKAGPLVLQ